jgi:hypothetical protein
MRPAKAVTLGFSLAALLSACSPAPEDPDPATPGPAAVEQGRAVCEGFFDDLRATPARVEQARDASPRLGAVLETFAEVVAERDAGSTPVEELEARANMAKSALEIVCEDEFGVQPPPGYAEAPTDDPMPVPSG